MSLRNISRLPLRWTPVRRSAVRLLLWKERLGSGLAFDPFSPEFHEDPYPLLQELRRRDPVHWMETARGWLITRYDDVSAILRDPNSSADRSAIKNSIDAVWRRNSTFQRVVETMLISLDPPAHTRLRNLVNTAFSSEMLSLLEPHIALIIDQLLDKASMRGSFDIIRDFAEPMPIGVIARMLGVPPTDQPRFLQWSHTLSAAADIAFSKDILDRADQTVAEMRTYFTPLFEKVRSAPDDSLLSALVRSAEDESRLSVDELHALCILLLAAGHETTTSLVGDGVLALLRQPEQMSRLAEDPSLVDSAVEELLRYVSPIQLTARRATRPFELGGKSIKEGDLLVLSLAAANRDPERFSTPEQLDVGRSDNRHIAFSLGPHYCLGASLARMEAKLTLSRIVGRFPKMKLDPMMPPLRRQVLVLRALDSLPVTVSV